MAGRAELWISSAALLGLIFEAVGCAGVVRDRRSGDDGCAFAVFETCVGAPSRSPAACSCTDGPVANPSSLADVLADRPTCVLLSEGSYGEVAVPAGVRLVGEALSGVTVADLVLDDGATVCELTVRGDGAAEASVTVVGGVSARIYGTRIEGGDGPGVLLGDDATLSLEHSTIAGLRSNLTQGAPNTAVLARGAANLTIRASAITDCETNGIFVAGVEGGPLSPLRLEDVYIAGGQGAGVVGFDTETEIDGLVVRDIAPFSFVGGRGMAFIASSVSGRGVVVAGNEDYGALFEATSVDLRGDVRPVRFSDNLRGIWIRSNATESVSLVGLELTGNRGQAIGIDNHQADVVIRRTYVGGTTVASLPVEVDGISAGVVDVAEGIFWAGPGQVTLDEVTFEDNALASVFVVGEARTQISDVQLLGLDAGRSLQHCSLGASLDGDLGGLEVVEYCRAPY